MECPPLYGGSGVEGSVTRATGTNLELTGPYEVVNLTMEGSATIRGTAGLDLDVRVSGNFDASTCDTGKISMTGRGAITALRPAGAGRRDLGAPRVRALLPPRGRDVRRERERVVLAEVRLRHAPRFRLGAARRLGRGPGVHHGSPVAAPLVPVITRRR